MGMEFVADIGDDSAVNVSHEVILTERRQTAKNKNPDDCEWQECQNAFISLRKNIVEYLLSHKRQCATARAMTQHAQYGQD